MRINFYADGHAGAMGSLNPFPKNDCQAQLLKSYEDSISFFGKRPDWLIVNGDAQDGPHSRGKAPEDDSWASRQVDSAATLIDMWEPQKICVISSTAYHGTVSNTVDLDEMLVAVLRAKHGESNVEFCYSLDVLIHGWFRLNTRHHTGGSSSPPALSTACNKSKMWGILNAYDAKARAPHLTVRAHVHRWEYGANFMGAHLLLPCWLAESRFGSERCEGHIDIGTCQLEVGETESEGFRCKDRRYPLPAKARLEWQ